MALSDELLTEPERLSRVRERVGALVERLGAAAGFLVDESGSPFATVGHVEFAYPHPLAGLMTQGRGDALLEALLGERGEGEASPYLVERAGARALLVVVRPSVPAPGERDVFRETARRYARELAPLLT